jgi:hypothetical protein
MRIALVAGLALFAAVPLRAAEPPPAPTGTLAITQQRKAVVKSEQIMAEALKRDGLLAQYLHMREARAKDTDLAFRLIFNQYLAWFQTFVGDYAASRRTFSIAQPAEKGDSPAPAEGGYTATPALPAIAELARGRKAVFFNENHTIALTRTLTVQMLEALRREGFDTFAAETLYHDDSGLAKRGYPIDATGFYTEEPIHAEMVRTALRLGYRVVAYEDESAAVGDERERNQARNLWRRAFGGHAEARLVVNAGFMHSQKAGRFFDGQAMAQHFRTISGIEPLSIEQTVLIPHEDAADDHPAYRSIIAAGAPQEPVVFRNAQGQLWSLRPAAFDSSVAFPPSRFTRGRPTWATLGDLRVAYSVSADFCRDTLPCLVEARYAGEGDDAIPADRFALDRESDIFTEASQMRSSLGLAPSFDLYLRPGVYRLVARNATNRVIDRRTATVRAPRAR